MKYLILLFIISNLLFGLTYQKTPSDVYSQALLLKEKLIFLRTSSDIKDAFPVVEKQVNKQPRHVLQKLQLDLLNIKLQINGDDFIINGLEGEFQQVILNIINNAKDVIFENEIKDGKIEIKTAIDNNIGIIRIYDNAGGIPTDVINRVFEPYYTTKEEGKGTGIGLYMSKMIIVDNMKGEITASNVNGGACFEIKVKIVEG